MIQLTQFIVQAVLLFFLSRSVIQAVYLFLKRILKNDHLIYRLVSALYFPGTVLHEVAHMLMAMVLGLKVREIHFLPMIRGHQIRLGHVIYEKKDVVRGVIVGIAPIFAGLSVFWFFAVFNVFPTQNILTDILFGYIIFVISSTMYSSKQDLIDLIYFIPLVIVLVAGGYFLKIDPSFILTNQYIRQTALTVFESINLYLLFSLIINSGIMVSIKVFLYLTKK